MMTELVMVIEHASVVVARPALFLFFSNRDGGIATCVVRCQWASKEVLGSREMNGARARRQSSQEKKRAGKKEKKKRRQDLLRSNVSFPDLVSLLFQSSDFPKFHLLCRGRMQSMDRADQKQCVGRGRRQREEGTRASKTKKGKPAQGGRRGTGGRVSKKVNH